MRSALSFSWRSLLATVLVAPVVACGDCPPSRSQPALPARSVTYHYTLGADGTVMQDGLPYPSCAAKCRTTAFAHGADCNDACGALRPNETLRGCAFEGGTLSCTFHYIATEERCSCDVLDC
jgi:hypothetical protein